MSQLASGSLHKFLTGETVTGDDTQIATNINIAFELLRLAHNDTDTRSKDTYTKLETDNKFYSKVQLDAGQLDNRYYTETEIDGFIGAITPNGSIFQTKSQLFTATEGQTVFTLTEGSYLIGYDRIQVYIDGVKQYVGSGDFIETSATSFTLSEGVPVGTKVEATWMEGILASPADEYKATLPPTLVSLVNGLQVLNNKQASPLNNLTIKGCTVVNLLGRDGNCEDTSKYIATSGTLALDASNKVLGSNSIKFTSTAATGAKLQSNTINVNTGRYYVIQADVKTGSSSTNASLSTTGYDTVKTLLNNTSSSSSFNTIGIACKLSLATTNITINVNLTGSTSSFFYVDAVRMYEITQAEYDNYEVPLVIDFITTFPSLAKYAYYDDVKHVNAPYVIKYGENLLPTFNDYTLNNGVANSPYNLVITSSGTVITANECYVDIPVLPSTAYTLSCTMTGKMKTITLNVNKSIITNGTYSTTSTQTVTTESNCAYLRVLFSIDTVGTYTFTNPMLNLGATAKPFKPRNDDMLAFPNVQLASNWDGTVYDTLFKRDGKYFVEKQFKDIELEGSLAWAFTTDQTGSKQVELINYITNAALSTANHQVVKYDGKILSKVVASWNEKDVFELNYTGNNDLYITINDTDSGWGESYTPTADEIKAYFYGWKLYDSVTITDTSTYTSGTKKWAHKDPASGTWVEGTTTLPTAPWYAYGGYKPYKLTYQLATPTFEEIQVDAGMSLHEGLNQLEVGQGVVVREKVIVYTTGTNAHINYIGTVSALKNRASKILMVYKNGKIDSNWSHISNGNEYGADRVYTNTANFDTTAIYEVTYIALDQYLLSNPVQAVNGETAANLKTVIDLLTRNDADQDARISALEINKARRVQGQWIAPTLLNGWISFITPGYMKDEFGNVRLKGMLQSGTTTANTVLFNLPTGYRPSQQIAATTNSLNSTTWGTGRLIIATDGRVFINDITGNTQLSLDQISFLAEQ